MIVLDENIPEDQKALLGQWGIRVRQTGDEIGRQGMKDTEIVPLLHHARQATFFTRELGFYDVRLRHAKYCLVCLAASQYEAASLIRRFLAHPDFEMGAKRLGKVSRVSPQKIRLWRLHSVREEEHAWV
jgi:hypothetical protein